MGKTINNGICIFCEGDVSEPQYLNHFRKISIKSIIVKKQGGFHDCNEFFQQCETMLEIDSSLKEFKDNIQNVWFLFDYDEHDNFKETIDDIRKKGYGGVAFSNMCFEYWILLHLINHNGDYIDPAPTGKGRHSERQIAMINKILDSTNQKAYVKEEFSKKFFEYLFEIDRTTKNPRIVDACIRAEKLHQENIKERNETGISPSGQFRKKSCTTVYQLIMSLGIVTKTPFCVIKGKAYPLKFIQESNYKYYYYDGGDMVLEEEKLDDNFELPPDYEYYYTDSDGRNLVVLSKIENKFVLNRKSIH